MQKHLYWPGTSNFRTYLQEDMILNYPLTTKDSVRADHIYVPARPLLQGGKKRHRNTAVKVPIITLLEDTSLHHKDTKINRFFYINGIRPLVLLTEHPRPWQQDLLLHSNEADHQD